MKRKIIAAVLLLIIATTLVAGLCLVSFSGGRQQTENKVALKVYSHAPHFFAGRRKAGTLEHSFQIRNDEDFDVTISDFAVSCNCASIEIPETKIRARSSCLVNAKMYIKESDLDFDTASIALAINGDKQNSLALSLTAAVEFRTFVSERVIHLGNVYQSNEERRTVSVSRADARRHDGIVSFSKVSDGSEVFLQKKETVFSERGSSDREHFVISSDLFDVKVMPEKLGGQETTVDFTLKNGETRPFTIKYNTLACNQFIPEKFYFVNDGNSKSFVVSFFCNTKDLPVKFYCEDDGFIVGKSNRTNGCYTIGILPSKINNSGKRNSLCAVLASGKIVRMPIILMNNFVK
jgi:hypothetical protein